MFLTNYPILLDEIRHLGNFFPKPGLTKPTFANKKWPVSHPGMHGFDEWYATEASASSSMCNCGCRPEWVAEGDGCVIGGGIFQHKSFACTNYWRQRPDNETQHLPCRSPESTLDCVTNLTSKIPGDDSMHIMDRLQVFLDTRKSNKKPFLALLFLHTVHHPHPAMPEYYFAYNDSYGNPAGDYLGTLTQMDTAIGRLRQMLQSMPNTMLWFTADNGPHTNPPGGLHDVRSATNGLRQCKASIFEGGIRVPGIVEWPAQIQEQRNISVPVSTNDFLPTVLDLLQVPHEVICHILLLSSLHCPKHVYPLYVFQHPNWYRDGESLLPLLKGTAENFSRSTPLGFNLNEQVYIFLQDRQVLSYCTINLLLYYIF